MIHFTKKLNDDIKKTVRSFNSKINRLSKKYPDVILPEKISTKELKAKYQTRTELRKAINDYKKFNKRTTKLRTKKLDNITITKWEYNKVKRNIKREKLYLDSEINRLKTTKPKIFGKVQDTTYAKMGDSEFENLKYKRKKLDTDITKLNKESLRRFNKFTDSLYNREISQKTFKERYLEMLESNAYFYKLDKNKADDIYNYFLSLDETSFYDMFKSDEGIKSILNYYNMIKDIQDNIQIESVQNDVINVMLSLHEQITN